MRKQYIAAGLAVLLAILGILTLVRYANDADERALKGTEVRQVLRVSAVVPKGTAADKLANSVETVKLPSTAIVPGAVTTLDDVAGLISSTELQVGEQLLTTRFVKKGSQADNGVPKGMQEITIPLNKARLVGGAIGVGNRVGIIASYAKDGNVSAETNMALNGVLITKYDSTPLASVLDEQTTAEITFAVKTMQAEKIVHALEFGKVWLTKQNDDTDTGGGKTIDRKDVTP